MAKWSERLVRALAWQEALIDFSDETLPATTEAQLNTILQDVADEMRGHMEGIARAERLRRGLVFVLVGAPNVGKSSLLNRLVGREAAIVSPLPGTTRDPVCIDLDLDGIPVLLIDTAGLREGADAIENEGIRRARARAAEADLVIEVVESSAPDAMLISSHLRVFNKCDISDAPEGSLSTSALTGVGLASLRNCLTGHAKRLAEPGGAVLTNARHATALRDACQAVTSALSLVEPELKAEELRGALNAVGRITGVVRTDDILGVIFGAFCIGK